MKNEALMEHIEQARAELLAVKSLTPADRDLVGQLMTEVVSHLTEEEPDSSESDDARRESLAEKLKEQVAHLEASHPKLAGMLDRLTSMLSSLGI